MSDTFWLVTWVGVGILLVSTVLVDNPYELAAVFVGYALGVFTIGVVDYWRYR